MYGITTKNYRHSYYINNDTNKSGGIDGVLVKTKLMYLKVKMYFLYIVEMELFYFHQFVHCFGDHSQIVLWIG